MHTNPVVSCSLFVERWDTYQQGSLISRKLIYLAKSYSASFLIFPAFHGNQTKLKKIRHKCIHIRSKTTKRIKFLNISILHFQFKPKQNQTKSNPIRNLLRLPIQTNQKEKRDLPWFRARCLKIHRPIGLSNSSVIVYQNLLELIQRTININK